MGKALEPYSAYSQPHRRDYSFVLMGVSEPYLSQALSIEEAANSVIQELGLTILGIPNSTPGDLGGVMFYAPIEGQSVLNVNSFPERSAVEAVLITGINRLPRLARLGVIFLEEFSAQEVSIVQHSRARLLAVRGNGNEIIARPTSAETAFVQARKRLTA